MARSGVAPSCAVEARKPGAARAGRGTWAGWTGFGLPTPGFQAYRGISFGEDRRERYRQRGRTVARP